MPDETKVQLAQPVRKRLFIGGLHQDVTADDLQQRFGRFGSVTSVDVRTKRDSQGQIVNVFAHMDINISETNFKKCSSIYNDTKWKGHTMKVQVAKEDFLTKLANERKEAKENPEPIRTKTRKQTEQDAAKERLEENMTKAGVEDFLMKKAVPGTPIPGETNWIVGKFGRVLPIMHMQRKDKRSQMTHDPSKYVHYVRKFKDDAKTDQLITDRPVEDLTWQLPEEVSDIDRKRMGVFPEYAHKKKIKRENQGILFKNESSQKKQVLLWSQDGNQSSREKSKSSDGDFEIVRRNGNIDGRRTDLVQLKPYRAQIEANVKSNQSTQVESNQQGHRDVQDLLEQYNLDSDEDSCGSADTDEICNFAKKSSEPEIKEREILTNWAEDYYSKEKTAAMSGDTSEFDGFRKEESVTGRRTQSLNSSGVAEKNGRIESKPDDKTNSVLPSNDREANVPARGRIPVQIADDSDDTDSDGSEREFEEGVRVEENDEDIDENGDETDDEEYESNNDADVNEEHSDGDDEDDEEDDDDDEEDDDDENSEEDEIENSEAEDNLKETTTHSHVQYNAKDTRNLEDKFVSHQEKEHTVNSRTETTVEENVKKENNSDSYSSSEDEGDASDNDEQSSSSSSASDSDSSNSSDASDGKGTPRRTLSVDNVDSEARKTALASPGDQTKHRQSNQIRLESVKKRQASILTQKAAIQEALKSLDSKKGTLSARTHVRFDSDDESSEADGTPKNKTATSKMNVLKRPGLFDSDEEETMDLGAEANDEDRFKIKPHFQGKAGEKLLKLQDRIGTDSRFKLGETFMEDDSEDDDVGDEDHDLKAEKQKSLSVLESIVGRYAVHSLENKTTTNFRDPSRVRYDPTSKDHTQFEIADASVSTGTSTKKKDKSRVDASIPEVSKDIFYDVKDLEFSQDKDENKPFRFFAEEELESEDEDVEGLSTLQKDIQASTALGKRQLTLDSSDSESETEEAKHDGKDDMDVTDTSDTTGNNQPTSAYRAFFFQPDDIRLKTGAEQFCRKLSLEGMNQWFEEQKAGLQGEYKKRHQRALRDSKKAAQLSSGRKPRR
ncbi:nucleolar protein 8-like [Patiria miniata]|uniref:RRM domain-containing protein n=1 Tax=Patiria miniata TaxID=46514 RepID=A0A913ZQD1_PATMI|nr:nucleolar protein 8-like [Patiria miniata]